MSQPAVPNSDPYAEQPSFWRTHADLVWAAAVFVATVVMTVLSFPPSETAELAYTFAAPAIFWAFLKPRFKLYAWTLAAAQAVSWTILLGWLHHVTWLGLILLGPFIGVWVGLWYVAVWWTIPRMYTRETAMRIAALLGLAALWVLLEWSRTWFLSGFPWLPLAASQWRRSAILQIASFTGAEGVSFILVMFNLGFAAYAHRLMREKETGLRRRSPEFIAAMLVLVFPTFLLLGDVFNQQRLGVGRIALVQPYIPQTIKWDPAKAPDILKTLSAVTLRAAAKRPDLIVWPEAVTPLPVEGDAGVRAWTERLVKQAGAPLLMGSVAIEGAGSAGETWFNGAFVVDPTTGLQPASYAKRKLVPFGEYVPFRPLLGWLGKFVPLGDGDFTAGEDSSPLLLPIHGVPIALGPLICYEDIFPSLARSSVRTGADVLIVLTNNGWFGEGGAAYQHAAHSVLRAVETRRPVIRCGNGGWSGWIDEFGTVRATMTNDDDSVYFRGTETYQVTRDARWTGQQSFYVQHGDWFIVVCVGLVLSAYGAVRFGRPRKDRDENTEAA